MPTTARRNAPAADTHDEMVDALLAASRVIVAVAARSLADLESDVTLPQYRTLVVLASRGPQRVVDIAAELGVYPSTGTRMCDRLVRKKLIRRYRTTSDRRAVRVALTAAGQHLVEDVTARRREDLARMVKTMPERWHRPVVKALHALAENSGEVPENEWWMGWHGADADEQA